MKVDHLKLRLRINKTASVFVSVTDSKTDSHSVSECVVMQVFRISTSRETYQTWPKAPDPTGLRF